MNNDIVAETHRVTHLFERLEVLERMVDDKFSDMQEKLSDMHEKFLDVCGKFSEMQGQIDEWNGQSGSSKGWKKHK